MSLKQHLFNTYNGFTDKRIKSLDRSDVFTADDRGKGSDFDAKRQLFYWFCQIYVRVIDDYSVAVELIDRGGVPSNPEVSNLLASWNAEMEETRVRFVVDENSTARLEAIATGLKDIVSPGKRYSTNWYKYVCPRTAESLLRLKAALSDYWNNPPTHRPLNQPTIEF